MRKLKLFIAVLFLGIVFNACSPSEDALEEINIDLLEEPMTDDDDDDDVPPGGNNG